MKKTYRKIMIIILSVFLLSFSACSKQEEEDTEITGVYLPVSCTDEDGNEYELEDEELHIEENGKGYFVFQDNRYELTWSYEDDVFSFVDSSTDEFVGTFENGVISGRYFYDYYYVFEKTDQ